MFFSFRSVKLSELLGACGVQVNFFLDTCNRRKKNTNQRHLGMMMRRLSVGHMI